MRWEYRRITFKMFAAEDIAPPGSNEDWLTLLPLPDGSMQQRWVGGFDTSPFTWALNEWGAAGWELVAVQHATNPPTDNPWATERCWFKRPCTDAEADA
ncbi:MAG: hypothetical protein AB7O92_29545 [Acidimicrobiia bacterium]